MKNIWHEGTESPVKTDTIVCKTSDNFLITCFFFEGQEWSNIVNTGFHSITDEVITVTSWCYLHELFNLQEKLKIAIEALDIIASGEVIEHSIVGHEDDNKIVIAKKALEKIEGI